MTGSKNVFYSKEVRWFFPEPPHALKQWFEQKKTSLEGDQGRFDYYLDMRPHENISCKIREGRTEIKLQLGHDLMVNFPNGHSGKVNQWVKWSLELKEKIARPDLLYAVNENSFISVQKKRVLVNYEVLPDGTVREAGVNVFPGEGCQVELTEILHNDKKWYSFGFEAFGTESMLDQHFEFVTGKLLNEINLPVLNEAISMSYPAFLASIMNTFTAEKRGR